MIPAPRDLARATFVLAAAVTSCACSAPTMRPNVLLISLDCFNHRQFEGAVERGSMPHLARLAGQALVFDRAYSHAPWTTPSHVSILSGLYPSQHGRNIPFGLMVEFSEMYDHVPGFLTLPQRLREAGYQTAAFVGVGATSARFGLGEGFDLFNEFRRDNPAQSDLPASQRMARQWLERRRPQPFFMLYHTFELHFPLAARRRRMPVALQYVDRHVGELLSFLEAQGLLESTLVIVTGDHGSRMIGAPGGKCRVHGAGHYDENLRVPLVMKLPGPGRHERSEMLVRHVDILPTVLDVVGLSREGYRGPGVSILQRLRTQPHPAVVSFSEADGRCVPRQAVVDGRYKYIYTPSGPLHQQLRQSPLFFDHHCQERPGCEDPPREELYDLHRDPRERDNLLDRALAPETAKALHHLRAELTANANLPAQYRRIPLPREGQASEGAVDESVREALRALGYIE